MRRNADSHMGADRVLGGGRSVVSGPQSGSTQGREKAAQSTVEVEGVGEKRGCQQQVQGPLRFKYGSTTCITKQHKTKTHLGAGLRVVTKLQGSDGGP